MKIAVLVKQVPVRSAVRFDPETRRLVREGVPSVVSSFDVRVLARAVELKEKLGGDVVALTMGPAPARAALAHCLALGADRGIHLVDRAFAGADTLATARVLARALARECFDLVLCGRSSEDVGTGQVGPEVAELLGVVQVTGARRLEIERGTDRLRVERETDDGCETVETRLPALLTAAGDFAEERLPSEAGLQEAGAKPILEAGAADLGIDTEEVGEPGSPTEVAGLYVVGSTSEARVIEGRSVADVHPAPDRPRELRGPGYWVVAELLGGEVRPVTFELLGKAGELAEQHGGHVVGLLVGGPAVAEHVDPIAAHGADIVCVADDMRLEPYTTDAHAAVVAEAIRTRQPAAVLIASTAIGRDLAPRVAARLGLGLAGGCIDLAVADDGRLVQCEPVCGADLTARVLSRTLPAIATVRPGMLAACQPSWARRIQWERLAVGSLGSGRLRVVARSVAGRPAVSALETPGVVSRGSATHRAE